MAAQGSHGEQSWVPFLVLWGFLGPKTAGNQHQNDGEYRGNSLHSDLLLTWEVKTLLNPALVSSTALTSRAQPTDEECRPDERIWEVGKELAAVAAVRGAIDSNPHRDSLDSVVA